MRVLLISDTHGNIDVINQLVEKTKADMVIHAGDFGFYDETSYQHLSTRELFLLITHSAYRNNYTLDKQTSKDELIGILENHKLLGDFSDYLNGKKRFNVPVYAVYGNHEDVGLIRKIKNHPIYNFHLLDEDNIFLINENDDVAFHLFGWGGNFLVSQKLLRQPIAGAAGKVWGTLHQFEALYQKLKNKSEPSICTSSPKVERLCLG